MTTAGARVLPTDRLAVLAALRSRLARSGRPEAGTPAVPLAAGLPGFARSALHELLAEAPGCGVGLAALVLARSGGTVLWIAGQDQLFAPGLARFGLPPERLVLVRADSAKDALWAMEEALRCPAVSGALLATATPPDLTASRRLQLAAEAGGGVGLLLRPLDRRDGPGAPFSRWRVASRPGGRWEAELLRARGDKPGGPWLLSWQEETAGLAVEPL